MMYFQRILLDLNQQDLCYEGPWRNVQVMNIENSVKHIFFNWSHSTIRSEEENQTLLPHLYFKKLYKSALVLNIIINTILNDAILHWWQWSYSVFSLLFPMLDASRNTFRDIWRNNVLPAVWPPLSLVNLKYKINHHRIHTWTNFVPTSFLFVSFSTLQKALHINICCPTVNLFIHSINVYLAPTL